MRLKLLLIIACVLIATSLVAPAVLLWSALYTTAGLQFVVRHIPEHLGPVRLVISGISGTAASGLSVERVQIDHELVHLEFTGITGRVALAPLLLQTIHVRSGSVHGALIEVKRRTHPSSPGPPQFLPRWMLISVDEGHVDGATLTVYNGFRMQVTDLEGAALIRHRYIRFFQADGHWADAHLSAIGFLRAADPIGFDIKGHLEWTPPGQPNWTLAGSARGDLNALSIVAHTVSPLRADLTGQLLTLTDHWHWVADAVVQSFDLAAWGMNGPLGQITAHLAGSGDENGFSAHGPVNPEGLHAGTFDAQFAGHWAEHVLTATHMEVRHVSSGAHATGSGTIAIVDNGPRLELTGSWTDFRWPLVGRDPAVRSAAGSFTLSGLMPYRVRVQGRGRALDLPEMPLEVEGTLDKDRFAFAPAEVELFGGHASVSGLVTWSPQETWSVSGHLANINPAALRPDLPGSVSFDVEASGRGFDPHGELTTSFRNVSGKLRGLAASGSGTVTHTGSAWGFSNVRVALGGTSLALDGRLDKAMDLRFALATRDLGLLAPGSRGELKAAGSVRGSLEAPAISGSAHGGDVDAFGVKLGSFDADVDLDPGSPQKESKVNVQLRKLAYQGTSRTLDSVAFTLRGPPAAYEAQLSVAATGLAVSLKASGPYARGLFKGQLNALTINGSQQLHLSLERPVDLTLSLEHARIEWLCLVGTPGSMCADGDWTPSAWSSTLMANQLPLSTLTAGMTPAVEYIGTASVLARLSGGASAPLQGTLRAELANAQIDHRLASHKVEHTRIGSGTVNVTAAPAQLSADAQLGDGEVGTLHAHLDVTRSTPGWADMPLTGELHAEFNESGLVSLYVPDIDRAAGHFSADVALAGTLGAPRLSGAVKLTNGEMDVYQVNLSLRQVQMEARLGDAGLDFSASAHAGAGTVSAQGHVDWRKLLPYGKFHLQGTNLRVADVPEAQIDASPDLDFSIAGRRIEVTGKVAVPYAKIQPTDITTSVRASPDEVLVGAEVEDPSKRFEVMSEITLALGDKVSIDAAGLTGRLVGSVNVRSGYDAITRGTGELSVVEGKYTAYARKLDIERGRLIFTGGPIDDPGIDMRAVKVFPDVKAGVNVRGTLLQPRLTFFSDPPLPQAQVASLILAGGSLESTQNRANGAGTAALGQGAALLAAQLGTRVGLPDVSLETDPIANETSLVLGHYLSPRLYVSYGVSLTEQLNTFKARYTLGDHWTVRVELGTARGADLVYSIEK